MAAAAERVDEEREEEEEGEGKMHIVYGIGLQDPFHFFPARSSFWLPWFIGRQLVISNLSRSEYLASFSPFVSAKIYPSILQASGPNSEFL